MANNSKLKFANNSKLLNQCQAASAKIAKGAKVNMQKILSQIQHSLSKMFIMQKMLSKNLIIETKIIIINEQCFK